MSARILVVDDEPQFLRALTTNLRGAGYTVETAGTVAEALAAAALGRPDAVVLDLLLPDGTGTEVCRELRTWSEAPIVVVSAVGDEAEKVAALDAGADDYVTKPFAIGELLARLRAALRRAGPTGDPVIEVGPIRVDLERSLVTMGGEPVHLTPHEFRILRLLAQNEGKLMTHRAILREVWGRPTARSRTTCTCTSRSCAGSSSPTRRGRATFSPRPAPATASSHLEMILRSPGRILSRP